MNIEEKIEKLWKQLLRRRFDGNYWPAGKGWRLERLFGIGQMNRIRELLEQGNEIRAGYHITNVRGYHDHILFYRTRP